MKRKSSHIEMTLILGGLHAKKRVESEPYSFASGSTYSVEVLRRTLTKTVEIHSKGCKKRIFSLSPCQMSETMKPDVRGCSAYCNIHSLASHRESHGVLKCNISDMKTKVGALKFVSPHSYQGYIVRPGRGRR